MYSEKYFYFSTGSGNDAFGESLCYPQSSFTGLRPNDATKLDLFFKPLDYSPGDVTVHNAVRLDIVAGTMGSVISSVLQKINSSSNMISIADFDNGLVCSPHIVGCSFQDAKDSILYYKKIVNATQVNVIPINTKTKKLKSMTLCNIHSSEARATVFISNSTDNWYIIKDVVIPIGATLVLEGDELDYDGDIFNLYVKLQGATPVDIIIR